MLVAKSYFLFISGEALGAIGETSVIPILEDYSKDSVPEVAETCQLALCRLQWLKSNYTPINLEKSPYMSVDPAPPADIADVDKLRDILLNETIPLFERYRTMFTLRNIRTPKSILALSEGKYSNDFLFSYYLKMLYWKFLLLTFYRFKSRQCLI